MSNRSTAARSVTINIRAKSSERDLIDQAAEALGKTRSDFMLESSRRAAESVLLDRCFFQIDAKDFAAFEAILDAPRRANPGLKKLSRVYLPWKS